MDDLLFHPHGLRSGPAAADRGALWVWIRNGDVVAVTPHRPEAPEQTPLHEGGWVIEPLADAHVHLFLCGAFDGSRRAATAALPRDEALQRILELLERYRSLGVVAVRDGGDPCGLALEAAAVANGEPARYAAVLPAGEPVRRGGLYGRFLGRDLDSAANAVLLLEENCRRGATHAKVLATGLNSLDEPGVVGPRHFTAGELAEIAAAARSLELPLMVHANGPLGEVLGVHPDSIEHGFWLENDDLARMADAGVRWVPTLGAWTELLHHPQLSAGQRRVIRATDLRHRRQVRGGAAKGVRIAAGSDAGTPGVAHGVGLVGEIRRLAAAGVPPEQALAAATHQARSLCAREAGRHLGGLQPGAPAGLVWLPEDPAQNPDTLTRPWGVYLGGRLTLHDGPRT